MADRYWVGGTGTWDTTAGTKWSTVSGGTGGASVPTTTDDVYFDANSGSVTVTLGVFTYCNSLICTGFTGTLAGGIDPLVVHNSVLLVSGMGYTHTGGFTFNGSSSGTLTTAGKTVGAITISKSSTNASISLQDALVSTGELGVGTGIFTTNNYSISALALNSALGGTRSINLGSSIITLSRASVPVQLGANLTFNAGTSTIILTGSVTTFDPCTVAPTLEFTFYNVIFANTSATTTQFSYTAKYIFNRLTVAAPSTAGTKTIVFSGPNTFNNGIATTNNTTADCRVLFRTPTSNFTRTLTINGACDLTDADFLDLDVVGSAAPISGTRIGDYTGCTGITFVSKIVYLRGSGILSWGSGIFSDSPTGAVNVNSNPLPQDIVVINNTSYTGNRVNFTFSSSMLPTLDMSARTNAFEFNINSTPYVYGNWINGSGVNITGSAYTITFVGRKTQTITSAGKTFLAPITIDCYDGSVELTDALNIGTQTLTVNSGKFDTKNYNITAGSLLSNNSLFRQINLGSSTVLLSTASPINFTTTTNLTFNAGTSTLNCTSSGVVFNGGANSVFYNVSLTNVTSSSTLSFPVTNTFNNLTIDGPTVSGFKVCTISADQNILGTLTFSGSSLLGRISIISDTLGVTRNLTANSLVATNSDFRDIKILGNAAGSSTTGTGDCGGNSGIVFPSPKIVYWNLAGAQGWTANGWASVSGGTPNSNNFPLAQDTAVFDNAGSVTGIISTSSGYSIGSINASARTNAMTFNAGNASPLVYGNWTMGSGVTLGLAGTVTFSGRGTTTITNNGTTFNCGLIVNTVTGTVQLADALILSPTRTLQLTSGTFDAVTYNVTAGLVNFAQTPTKTLKMGSGTWTLSGTGTVWSATTVATNFYKGTANIVLSDNSTTARTFSGASLPYNKLTIGGTTGTSTLTITGNNIFTELASIKTVAHTIAFGTTVQTFGKWTVTGTAGNVVTVTGTGVSNVIAGPRVSGVDYLAMGSIGFSTTSPGEFYAGANSTGTNATIIKTAAPVPVTRYWIGGTGTWDATTTTNWSATSGGTGGASVPTSADTVVFNSSSNSTAYTVTCTATQLRCASLTVSAPASGNVTWAGTAPITIHGNLTLPATGLTRSYTGTLTFSGATTGNIITTNGVQLSPSLYINGIGCEYSFGSAINTGAGSLLGVTAGSLSFGNYAYSGGSIVSSSQIDRSISFGSSTVTLTASTPIDFGTTATSLATLNFSAGTSNIICNGGTNPIFNGRGLTFYNLHIDSNQNIPFVINGKNTFNNLTFTPLAVAGVRLMSFSDDQVINGTFTAGGNSAGNRGFIRSSVFGTQRKLTCASVSLSDLDIQDILFDGSAAPVSGTRLGDCAGNGGVTFDAAKTVYWSSATGANWNDAVWSATINGAADVNQFPLAQDTAVFTGLKPNNGQQVIVNANYNIGTIDMSARTGGIFYLNTGILSPVIYGNWINSPNTISATSGSSTLIFSGRKIQIISSAGGSFGQSFTIDSPGGSVVLQDALNVVGVNGVTVNCGTINANGYNLTANNLQASGSFVRTIAVGSGTWTLTGTGSAWQTGVNTNLTVTGTGTISLTSASAKTFSGGSTPYSGITLNQGGLGTLTVTGNNTFKDITNTYGVTGATTISFGSTIQTLSQFTASGTLGNLITISGTSTAAPANLILTGSSNTTAQYVSISNIRMYKKGIGSWIFKDSINLGTFGATFGAVVIAVFTALGNFFTFF